MEKSILHSKAEHPSLVLTSLLLLGIGISHYIVLPHTSLLILLLVSCLGLAFIIHSSVSVLIKSIVAIICIVYWGICIIQLNADDSIDFLHSLEPYIAPLRKSILQKIDILILNPNNNGFAKALLIGEKTLIDPSITEAYTALGIVHIIAISGMHLDIIGKYLISMTEWLPKQKWLQIFELIFIITIIIAYTLVTHASPSVIRAALFFCIIKIGTYFNLHQYILNSVANGILIILLLNHQSITHIGWQLSYAAVLGIHIVHPSIQKIFLIKNPAIQGFWNNFSITVATQITTLPLLIYYFNQVSTGIILSNMVMIPLSNILLQALIILILLPYHWCQWVHWGQIIEIFMQKMMQVVEFIFTISPQPLYLKGFGMHSLLVYYTIFLYLCLWKKRYNQPLSRFFTKMA
jgi:competence protein ComEC